MSGISIETSPTLVRPFRFESYGVTIEITSNQQDIVDHVENVCRNSLLNRIKRLRGPSVDHVFYLPVTKSGILKLIHNGNRITWGRSRRKFFKFFDSILRVTVGEYSPNRVFMHAGVVGWKGRALLFPANSFKGKTSLVAELVRSGADYYSDDFAIFDEEGYVHSFPRPLAMRDAKHTPYAVTVDDLGGTYGTDPIRPGLVLFTEYVEGAAFRPKILTPGQGVLGMVPYALSIRQRPNLAFSVLNKIASHAIIASGRRGSAEIFARTLLNFVDKHVD